MTGTPTPQDWDLAQALKLKDCSVEELDFARKTQTALALNSIHRRAIADTKEVLS